MSAMSAGATSAAPVRRKPGFLYLPIVPEGHCELCGRAAEILTDVVIDPAREIVVKTQKGPRTSWRMARSIRACARHARGNGAPLRAPRQTMLPGTTQLRPQAERLFDSIPYCSRAGRHG